VAQAERATRASFATAASLGRELCTMRLTLAIGSRSASPIAAPPCAHALCARCLWKQQCTAFEVQLSCSIPFRSFQKTQETAKKRSKRRFVSKLNQTATCPARKEWRGRALLSTHIQGTYSALYPHCSLLGRLLPLQQRRSEFFSQIKRRSQGWITSWA